MKDLNSSVFKEDFSFSLSYLLTFSNLTALFTSKLTFYNGSYITAKVYSNFFRAKHTPTNNPTSSNVPVKFYNRVVVQRFDMSVQCSWTAEVKCFAQEHTDVIAAGRTKNESFFSHSAKLCEPNWSFHQASTQFHPCWYTVVCTIYSCLVSMQRGNMTIYTCFSEGKKNPID